MTEGYAKFPVSRPLKRKVDVIFNGVKLKGRGVETFEGWKNGEYIFGSGGGIEIDGKVYNSNHVIYWKYDKTVDNSIKKVL